MKKTTQKQQIDSIPMSQWSVSDQPREKMVNKGRQVLSDAELLAIILGTGTRGESALNLGRRIMNDYGHNLYELGKASVEDLVKKYRGIGPSKAINIVAALELGRRRQASEPREREKIRSSRDAYDILYPLMADLHHEEFAVLFTNRASRVITVTTIGRGSMQGVVVDIRLIVRMALDNHASGIIVCHNHPSGILRPSEEDKKLTKSVREAAGLFNITLHDHIIIADKSYFSFADENMI